MEHVAPSTDAHPLAQRVFHALEGFSDGGRRAVYEALRDRLAGQLPEHLGQIAGALRECATDLGLDPGSVSHARYVEWRRAGHAGTAPAPSQVRRAGRGSWSRGCAAALGLPLDDPLHRRLFGARRPYGREAMLSAVIAFAEGIAADEYPSAARYGQWAAGLELESPLRHSVPLTAGPMIRRFGSWDAALGAAGVIVGPQARRPTTPKPGFTREAAVQALLAADQELGPPLSCNRYDEWAFRRRESDQSDGGSDRITLPSSSAIARRFGGWRAAVRTVLGPRFPVSRGRSTEYSHEELARAWPEFVRYTEQRPSEERWESYRERTRDDQGAFLLPSSATLKRRVGDGHWSGVCRHFGFQSAGRVGQNSGELTHEELVAGWNSCSDALGAAPRSKREYDRWRERCRTRAGGSPPASSTLMRRLGNYSWRELYARLEGAVPPDPQPSTYSMAQIRAAWFGARAWLGRPPSISGYRRYRAQRMETAEGSKPSVPVVGTMVKAFGSWRELHRQMEGPEGTQAAFAPTKWSDVDLIAFLRRCASETGQRPSIAAYEAWRRIERIRAGVAPPKNATISRRLGAGSWMQAVTHAIDDVPDEHGGDE